jgi:hypothetical protein
MVLLAEYGCAVLGRFAGNFSRHAFLANPCGKRAFMVSPARHTLLLVTGGGRAGVHAKNELRDPRQNGPHH